MFVLGESGAVLPFQQSSPTMLSSSFLFSSEGWPCQLLPFCGLLDFYALNLTHLNPNSVLQIVVFVHLCEAFLGILPHFGLWKYLYPVGPGWLEDSISLLAVLA